MICPFATYKPISTNQGGPMSGVRGLVLHVQQGNGSLWGYFNNASAQVSAHFWCSKDGLLEQYLDTNTVAWAEMNGNPWYLSVETEGFETEALTTAQTAMIARLLSWAAVGYGFPVTGPVPHGARGFTPHCNPDGTPDPSWGNHPCPGSIRLGQMPSIVTAAAPPANLVEGENMTSMISGGQIHVWGIIGTTAHHWWQQVGAATWSHEVLPA